MSNEPEVKDEATLSEKLDRLVKEIETVFLGKERQVELALVTLFAGGHLIIEDVPGLGKTVLANAMARALDCDFRRIQFTPDLLPSDLLGVTVYRQETAEFTFKPGPVFANIVLADEINRATPRTQSSLLEAMNEAQVTVDGVSHKLPQPFCVLATRNPFEPEGTYYLPESELDRFFLCMEIGYPDTEVGKEIIRYQQQEHPLEQMSPVMGNEDVIAIQKKVRRVEVSEDVLDYMMELVERTRENDRVVIGASPRAGIHLYRASQALALIRGRDYCQPDDVKELAIPVLAHRIRCKGVGSETTGFRTASGVVRNLLERVPVPI